MPRLSASGTAKPLIHHGWGAAELGQTTVRLPSSSLSGGLLDDRERTYCGPGDVLLVLPLEAQVVLVPPDEGSGDLVRHVDREADSYLVSDAEIAIDEHGQRLAPVRALLGVELAVERGYLGIQPGDLVVLLRQDPFSAISSPRRKCPANSTSSTAL